MTDITATLKQAHVELWAFREEMADVWPTLDTYLSLQCAVCEAAEALDAWIRMTYPWMARNRDRLNGEEAVLNELADCAMMLLTAMGQKTPDFDFDFLAVVGPPAFDHDNLFLLDMLPRMISNTMAGGQRWELRSLEAIATYPGMDLLPRLQARYARIRAKQRPNTVQDAYRRNAEKYARQLGQPYAPNATQPDDDTL